MVSRVRDRHRQRQTHRHTGRHSDAQTYIQAYRQTHAKKGRHTHAKTYIQTHRRTGAQTDAHKGRHADTQTHRWQQQVLERGRLTWTGICPWPRTSACRSGPASTRASLGGAGEEEEEGRKGGDE